MDRFRNTRQPDWDWWGRLWPTPGATLRRLGIERGDTLAEVGSGDGYFALPAARIADPAAVYALDVDESLLAVLSELAEQQGIENVVPIHGDARSLRQHLPEPVDVVLVANTLHGVDAPAALLEEVAESLRSGGRFVVVNWHDAPREVTTVAGESRGPPTDLRMSSEETRALVGDAAPFTLEGSVELPPYHYGLLFER